MHKLIAMATNQPLPRKKRFNKQNKTEWGGQHTEAPMGGAVLSHINLKMFFLQKESPVSVTVSPNLITRIESDEGSVYSCYNLRDNKNQMLLQTI